MSKILAARPMLLSLPQKMRTGCHLNKYFRMKILQPFLAWPIKEMGSSEIGYLQDDPQTETLFEKILQHRLCFSARGEKQHRAVCQVPAQVIYRRYGQGLFHELQADVLLYLYPVAPVQARNLFFFFYPLLFFAGIFLQQGA
jgi:hypothetical protein